MSETDPVACLREAVMAAGSQTAYAELTGIPQSYLSDVLNGHKPASERLLTLLGLKRVVVKVV